MFMSIDEHGFPTSHTGRSPPPFGQKLVSCRNLGVEDVGTLLLDEHVLMLSECVKIVVCQKSYHMVLMSSSIVITCVVDV